MTAMREISKWEAMSPVIRGRSRSRSRILRLVGSERATQTGLPSTSSSACTSLAVGFEHVTVVLHIVVGRALEEEHVKSLALGHRRLGPALGQFSLELGKRGDAAECVSGVIGVGGEGPLTAS